MMAEYVRLNRTVQGFGNLIPRQDIRKYISDNKTDWYRSLYYYDESAKDYVESNNGSIAGFKGNAFTDKLVFDFDSKDNLEQARTDAVSLLLKLQDLGIDVEKSTQCFFSGSKGFNVEITTSKKFSIEEVEAICKGLGEGLSTFDKVIYNTTRLYRIDGTVHQKSGLYKIELEPQELIDLTIEQIKELAKQPRDLGFSPIPFGNIEVFDKFKSNKPVTKSNIIVNINDNSIRGLDDIDFGKCPKSTPRCIYALLNGVAKPGERSRTFFILAKYLRNQGLTKEAAHGTLKGVARSNKELYPEYDPISKDEIWNQHISSAYSARGMLEQHVGTAGTSFDEELLQHYCSAISSSKPCSLHGRKEAKKEIVRIDEISDNFKYFAQDIDSNTIKTGINFYDDNLRIMVGTPTLVVGATGSGKTTLSLNIIENNNRLGLNTMFFSLDMNKNMIYLKLAQKLTRYNQYQILDFYKQKNLAKIEEIRQAISSVYGKTYFDFTTTQSLDSIQEKIIETEQTTGQKVKLVVIDYADRLVGEYSDEYSNSRYNALKSVEVSDNTQTALMIITQVARQTGDGSTALFLF